MQIPLTQGKVALIDDADAPLVAGRKWHAEHSNKRGADAWYAVTYCRGRNIRMHRLLMNPAAGVHVDHRDGDGLNNHRSNLRLATPTQNTVNAVAPVRNRFGFKGVVKSTKNKQFAAYIGRDRIGCFPTAEAAARAYDDAARERWGEFARFNFPREGEQPARRVTAVA